MPANASTAFFRLLDAAQNALHPPGKEKRDALLVEESEWEGVEAWLEKWRGKQWPQKRISATPTEC